MSEELTYLDTPIDKDVPPEDLWNEVLEYALDLETDDYHPTHLIEIEASHDSPLWKLDGVEMEYPDYATLDRTLAKVFGYDVLVIFVLYEMVIVEHEHKPERVKVVALDSSGSVIHV
jgi:hypothetical protein